LYVFKNIDLHQDRAKRPVYMSIHVPREKENMIYYMGHSG